ncbi:MAG TPA: hypothetical protein VIR14_07930 [Gaiellaceae bacterium]
MSRSLIPLTLILFAAALLAVPAALAKGGHRAVGVRGACTQQSTSKLKLTRENRGIEVEFQVDQNRNAVPWKVTLRRNGHRVASFTATTRAPSGSFEIRRVIADRPGADRINARAVRSGESCTASGTAPKAKAAASTGSSTSSDDPANHDAGDDHGRDG